VKTPGLGRPINYGAAGVSKRLEALDRLVSLSGERLLDVGCGNGAYTERMAERFHETVAIDVAADHTAGFAERAPANVTVRVLDAANLDYPDEYFEKAVMIEVLEHVADIDATLCQIRRVLLPGGFLLVTVPNRWFPIETHRVRVGRFSTRGRYLPLLPWIPPLHHAIGEARTFTLRSLRAAVEPHQFAYMGHTYVMPPFDHSRAGSTLRPLTDALERTPLRMFGVSLVAAFLAH
jgi:ubiquinone/menaquinone biosynthesis C-methylase UbiE